MPAYNIKQEIFLKKGKLRNTILTNLDKPKTATDLSRELNKHRSSISRVLLELEIKGFIKCVNPRDDRFRHYVRK